MEKKLRHRWFRRAGKTVLGCMLAFQAMTGFALPGETVGTAAAADAPQIVGTWMWNPYFIEKDPDGTLQQLSDKGVNRVYLFVDLQFPEVYYSSFIRKASAKGIEVRALSGAPNWVLPEHNKKMYAFIDWVKRYNSNVQPDQRFNGIHLDVEPYVLPEWRQNSDAVIGLWMDTVSGFKQEVQSDSNLSVGMDMPVWLNSFEVRDGYGGRTTLSDWFIQRMDQVTLMAYFDDAKVMAESVKDEIAEADRAGVPVLMAVDTVNSGDPKGTFYGRSQTAMQSQLDALKAAMSGHPSFRGVSVHEWDTWILLDK
ncbi:hypothetical protein [Paenibacillus piri]|uniref:Amidase n=1 Tax=Paenibacillus piri TaxID=2547395 RepID=A0A4R5KK53_9BACL|nr:hypothetical protein [Paenibacillus piri]TDF95949.1 hypothetical protein E1757_19730 [Paenibacillus piri]